MPVILADDPTLTPAAPAVARRRLHNVAALVALGALAGLTYGVALRLWMRLVSDNPEFTWGGTLPLARREGQRFAVAP